MIRPSTDEQTFSAVGEIVGFVEEQSQRYVKVVLTEPVRIDVSGGVPDDVHLGDRVVVHGWMGIEKEAV